MSKQESTAAGASIRGIGWSQFLVIICAVAIVGLGYGLHSTRNTFEHRVADLEASLDATTHQLAQFRTTSEGQATELVSNVDALSKRVGLTADDLEKARLQMAQRMKQQQELVEQKMATELASKASSTDVDTLRKESANKLAEVQQEANTKLGSVSNDVSGVKEDLASARRDFSRDLTDVKNVLSDGIARNATELAQLRQKGEREYIEFDLRKNQKTPFERIGDIQIALTKTDVKKHKYSVMADRACVVEAWNANNDVGSLYLCECVAHIGVQHHFSHERKRRGQHLECHLWAERRPCYSDLCSGRRFPQAPAAGKTSTVSV